MVNIYTGSNTVEHFLGSVTKRKINTMFRTILKHGYYNRAYRSYFTVENINILRKQLIWNTSN